MAKETQDKPTSQGAADALKSWTMVVLTFVFVVLYGAALFGWLKPLSDVTMITRLEPIIFVIIGYYFGRLPAQQTEKTLKEEIGRQTQKADAAQHAKEQAQQTRESVEEKIKNVSAALTSAAPASSAAKFVEDVHKTSGPIKEDGLRYSVGAALQILNS
jgi:choline-glycine betaine transporter